MRSPLLFSSAARSLALGALMVLTVLQAAAPPRARGEVPTTYLIEDVGFVGFDLNEPGDVIYPAINAAGQVAGGSLNGNDEFHAFRVSADLQTHQDLGALSDSTLSSNGFAINLSGQVVGTSEVIDGKSILFHGFIANPGSQMADVGVLAGGEVSEAHAINTFGDVVGESDNADSPRRAFLRTIGAPVDLGALPGFLDASAFGINDSRVVVGLSESPAAGLIRPQGVVGPFERATRWQNGNIEDLGALPGGENSAAYAVNATGQVVGESENSDFDVHAFRLTGSTMLDLGTLGGPDSIALAINADGDVVGTSDVSPVVVTRPGILPDVNLEAAFIYTDADGLVNLNSRLSPTDANHWELVSATGINDLGQIVGVGLLDGEPRAFRLTPPGDTGKPVLSGCSVTPRQLPVTGGQVSLLVQATDTGGTGMAGGIPADGVTALISGPGVNQTITLTPGANNTYTGTFTAPANPTAATFSYTVHFEARDNDGNVTNVDCGTFAVSGSAPGPPAPPSDLTAAVCLSQIELHWTDNSSDEAQFVIERKQGGGSFTELATVEANVTVYTDTRLPAATTFTYRIRSRNGAGNSGPSNEAGGITPTVTASGKLKLTPKKLNFGTVKRPRTKSKALKFQNVGSTPLTVCIGPASAPFTVLTSPRSFTLQPKEKRTVVVQFAPTAAGRFLRTLAIATTDPAKPATDINLVGKGK